MATSDASRGGCVGVNLFTENGVPGLCAIKRLAEGDAFSRNEIALFTTLVPHLIRATKIHRRFWEFDLKEGLARGKIDSRADDVIVVDAKRRILFMSDSAVRLMDEPRVFCLEAGALSAVNPDAATVLQRLIHDCVDGHRGNGGPGGSLTIGRHGHSPLDILVAPFSNRQRDDSATWQMLARPAVVILITDPEREKQLRKSLLESRFGLTSAEAHLALEIHKGDGREAAAARLRITPGTARIHLQRVFDKMGVHRQAELVRVIANMFEVEGI